ncbi:hypothetical protein ACFOOL_02440 [Devosia honganensis]|uniref:Glycosyl hydrolase n=1 Tax=Devosia honganensis TaxID=1610527 RepID=A0ABV7WZ69_9HYPH
MAISLDDALNAMIRRVERTAAAPLAGFPHHADPATGQWTTSPDGFWTGGYWVGQLWLADQIRPGDFAVQAENWLERLAPRAHSRTVFRGFLFLHAAALGADLAGSARGRTLAIESARSLASTFDERAGLMPLGRDAEEAHTVSDTDTNIDGLTASPLLLWAAKAAGDAQLRRIALSHARRNAHYCVLEDGGVIQSASFDARSGEIRRRFTHKGLADDSIWTRAQAWAMLGYTLCAGMAREEADLLDLAIKVSDWWLDHAPADHVAYWDFAVPQDGKGVRDSSGTAIAAAALLKLSRLVADPGRAERYRMRARAMIDALVERHLVMENDAANRPVGLLADGCFDMRSGVATANELIWGSYYLLESLLVLHGDLHGKSEIVRP